MKDIIVQLYSKGGILLFSHTTKGTSPGEVAFDLSNRPFFSKHIDEWGCNMIARYI
jgi:hypothetical protein